ncbi:glycosyltransferase family 4 protein [Aquimarina sp. 2201CG14-23]|uniref:glycosyltransferase family 4 protein n=1 Tax=Aquimarina mycalae TaxID=3040073 RepID=UPI002477DE6D|nr:glycosyltransferase family 4 protein [Aquimarina sp. 2201CG14-23]MDH7445886.1 glycosyltransferase family 4 protein [Aquimarina sp. 2201CG14-23]
MLKILLITYYWPPAGGPGVQRWLKFVKYFKEFGIEPIVYIPENPTYPLEDDSLFSEIPEGTVILKHPIFEPYRFAEIFSKKTSKTISKGIITQKEKQSFVQRLLLFIRGNFFIPDARKFWIKPSVKFLSKYISEEGIETVITTGPPHSVHLIGKKLKKTLNINWVADFRDPWTTIGYHHKLKLTKRSKAKHKTFEKQVLIATDHLTVTSFTTKNEFQQITNKPISVITNGYDTEIVSEKTLDTKFTISHIGSLLSGRNPKQLWKALYDLCQENLDFANSFRLQLVGAVSDDVLSSIKEYGLSDYVKVNGYVSHKEAIRLQRSSQVLLLIEIDSDETKCIIPGKLFEYMVSKRPILAIGPKDADISKLIEETNSGSFFEYHEYLEIKKTIITYFEKFQKGKLIAETLGIEKYSRRALTKEMSIVLKNLKK